jgi:hypothetical protein
MFANNKVKHRKDYFPFLFSIPLIALSFPTAWRCHSSRYMVLWFSLSAVVVCPNSPTPGIPTQQDFQNKLAAAGASAGATRFTVDCSVILLEQSILLSFLHSKLSNKVVFHQPGLLYNFFFRRRRTLEVIFQE